MLYFIYLCNAIATLIVNPIIRNITKIYIILPVIVNLLFYYHKNSLFTLRNKTFSIYFFQFLIFNFGLPLPSLRLSRLNTNIVNESRYLYVRFRVSILSRILSKCCNACSMFNCAHQNRWLIHLQSILCARVVKCDSFPFVLLYRFVYALPFYWPVCCLCCTYNYVYSFVKIIARVLVRSSGSN